MIIKRLNLSVLLCVSVLLAAASTANAGPIVANGTFATGLTSWTTSGTGTTPGHGIQAISGFGSGFPSTAYGDLIPTAPGGTTTGAFFVDDNANPEILSQFINLGVGTYTLSFDLFATGSGAANPFFFTLTDSVGAVASQTFGNPPSGGVTGVPVGVWTPETLTFTTTSATSYDLAFTYFSGAYPAKDVVLTDVAVAPTPEPSSFVLLGTGLLAAAGMMRRRMRA
jgi:hypothetical protein